MGIYSVEWALVGLNVAAGFGCAVPLARHFHTTGERPRKVLRCYVTLIGVYFIECVALVVGMGIPVFSVGLAVVWGIIIGLWMRRNRTPKPAAFKTSLYFSLYSSLPAASFMAVPVGVWLRGWHIVSAEQGARFGIPGFLPWPLTTILGFYGACAVGAVVLKTVVTMGEAGLLIHFGEESTPSPDPTFT